MLEDFNVLERVGADGDQVGEVAGGERADVGGAADEVGGGDGRGLDGLGGGHAVEDHIVELLGVVAVGVDAGVGAEGHLDPGSVGLAEVVALELADAALLGELLLGHANLRTDLEDVVVVVDVHDEVGAVGLGERDALIVMSGQLAGLDIVACAFEFRFLGGSMGSVVGEKFVRAVELCLENRLPLVCFSASGGARMQEALYSLLQMAKTSAALKRLSEARLPFISVMTDPTTGGVSASLAMLGDINIGEPKALIGFAGPRVIQQTVRETLPEGFQRSEFLLEHGALDLIVDRRELRDRIGAMLRLLTGKEPAAAA